MTHSVPAKYYQGWSQLNTRKDMPYWTVALIVTGIFIIVFVS